MVITITTLVSHLLLCHDVVECLGRATQDTDCGVTPFLEELCVTTSLTSPLKMLLPIKKGGQKKPYVFFGRYFRPTSDVNILETVCPIYLKINVRRVASGDSLHINF